MDKNAETYAKIFNKAIMDFNHPFQSVSPMTSVSIAAGRFKGVDVPVNTVVIEDRGIVNISVQFRGGEIGYETNIFTWVATEDFVRKAAAHAHSRIMTWNQWDEQEASAA